MSNVQSYNALIDRFKAFASGHFILKSFSHGQIDTADLEKFTEYPFMHVVPSNVTYAKGTKTFSFQIVLADLPRDKDDKVEFQREVLSDLQRIAEDLVAEITNHRVLFGDLITVQNVSLEPFLEEFHNTLTGWTVSLDLLVPYYWDACSIPAEWNDMFESGSGGTGSILTFIDSITRDENGNVSLVNDEATPAPNYYYGTNDEGVRGWYLLTDEVGLTCATIGTCQTIIDIEAEIDLLQQDVTDLQADIVAIETELPNKVPYTGATQDVNLGEFGVQLGNLEFDITPTNIPTAQGSVYWDDNAETLALIMNGTTQKVGEDTFYHVRNTTGSTIPKGTAVRFAGTTGNSGRLLIAPMIANGTTPSQYYMGVTSEEILNNADGKVYQFGKMRGVNTSSFADGDILYVSTTVAGGFQTTQPTAPNNIIVAAAVVHSANNGTLMIRPTLGSNINADEGVLITTPANNEVLTYESSTSLWKNKTVATALGYTPVPTTRSITINGTTQDLSTDRTFSVGTVTSVAALTLGTTGTDLSSTVANSTSTPVITLNVPTASATNRGALSSADWSTFNSKLSNLTVGTTTIANGAIGRVLFEGTGNVLQESANLFWDNTNSRLGIGTATPISELSVSSISGITLQSGAIMPNLHRDNTDGAFLIRSYSTGTSTFTTNVKVRSNGNFLIGTTTDAGYKLDVNGTTRTSRVDSLTNQSFSIQYQGSGNQTGNLGDNTAQIRLINNLATTSTTGTNHFFSILPSFAPTSGTTIWNAALITPTINQTGGANGITRGIYINPTLTAASDFRAIEVASGTTVLAPSVTARASLRIPSGTAPTSPVNGDIWFDGTNIKMQIGGVTKTFTLI